MLVIFLAGFRVNSVSYVCCNQLRIGEMLEHQLDCPSEPSRSYDRTQDNTNEEVLFENSSVPLTNSRTREYNTFSSSSGNPEELRTRSVSMPSVVCNSRTFKSCLSGLNTHRNLKVAERLKSNSTGNINDRNEYSVEYSILNEEDVTKEVYCCGLSKRQVKSGIALCLISVLDVMGFSIFSPFFPVVANEKNLSEVQIGLIFSAFSMAGIFTSIITGTLLVRVGAKFIILAGLFWSAGATICFGLLERTSPETFFYVCFACRIFMGIGSAMAFTAIFAVIFQEFSDRALTVIGISESLCSIGGITGPLIGGALYEVGGYVVPFVFLGCLQFCVLIVSAILIPPVAVQRQANAVSPAWLLLNIHGLFAALFVILSFTVNSFMTANLSLFLIHSFGVSTFMVGVFMLVFSVFYGISTPIWGYIADSKNCGPHMMTLCGFLGGVVMSLFGPADFWQHMFGWSGPQKWLVFVSMGLTGAFMGGLIMPTFGEMIVAAKQTKLQSNELAEYGMVSGLWNTAFSVGDILGPTVGGAVVEKLDYENTLALFGAMMCGLALLKTVHLVYLTCKARKSSQNNDESAAEEDEEGSLLNPDGPSVQS